DWHVPGNGAEIYENLFVPAMLAPWASRAVALANLEPGEHVLDIACGTGVLTRLAAKAVAPNGRVGGLDLTPEMLAVARSSPLDATVAVQIEWREGNALALPFEDATFDVALSNFGLMFFPEKVRALQEMGRVLKPGGRFVVMVWGSMAHSPGQMAMKQTWER